MTGRDTVANTFLNCDFSDGIIAVLCEPSAHRNTFIGGFIEGNSTAGIRIKAGIEAIHVYNVDMNGNTKDIDDQSTSDRHVFFTQSLRNHIRGLKLAGVFPNPTDELQLFDGGNVDVGIRVNQGVIEFRDRGSGGVKGRLQMDNGSFRAGPLAPNDASRLRSGSGAPPNSLGANGDFYFRTNGAAGSALYYKSGGSWTAIA